jgi:two-component system, NarL family, response regulator LiaR
MSTQSPIRILIVDDHRHIHEAVELALSVDSSFEIVGHGSSGDEALLLCETLQPQIVLMDVVMAGMNGIEATHLIHQQFPDIMILALSSYDDDQSIREMLRKGAVSYIPKDTIARSLVSAIRSVVDGNTVLPASTRDLFVRTPETTLVPEFELTERELEVLRLVASGMTNPQIASELFISPSTVKFHLSNILRKMQVETRAEAIVIAAKTGLV